MASAQKKLGLALGSGGIKGMVHLGVLKVLENNGIRIDYLAGSSIGAFVGAHYSLYKDLEKLEKVMTGDRMGKLRFLLDPGFRVGLINGSKMEAFVTETLGDAEFSDLQIPFRAIATDLVRGERVVFAKGKLAPAVRASMTIPSVFRPIIKDEMVLVDGAVSCPIPDDIVRRMGAERVISISLDNYRHVGKLSAKPPRLTSILLRSIDVMQHHLSENALRESDMVISPRLPISGIDGWAKYFTGSIAQELMRIGELSTEKAMPEIRHILEGGIFRKVFVGASGLFGKRDDIAYMKNKR